MDKKEQLPDEILDAVAGGAFTLAGQPVTDLSITGDGISISVAGQTFSQEWSEKEKAEFASNPKGFSVFKDIMSGMQQSSTQYDLEETLKALSEDD